MNKRFLTISLAVMVILQPLITLPLISSRVQAQEDDPTIEGFVEEDFSDVPEEVSSATEFVASDFIDLETLSEMEGSLIISPEDASRLKNSEVDVRVTDYLLSLVLPEELGGYGLDHVRTNRIFKNYTSEGAGKYDREGTGAVNDEDVISGHNRGQAVDISEVGSVTCKLVYKRHLGGSTTKWQKPTPVKVAWQSVEGIKNSPTPTSQSLLGSSADMSAQGIVRYLNESGELDYYIDFVKGMDLRTIVGYVGANVYLKTWGVSQVLTDPLADGLLHALGGALIEKQLPGLPSGIAAGNNDDDARVAFAKARLEQGLGLPPGSLRGYGWDSILESTGKRHLESSLGLPALYFESHGLDEANAKESIQTTLKYLKRNDDALNLALGTVERFKANDALAFKLAGVNLLASSLKLTADQKAALETAVNKKEAPSISLLSSPTDNSIASNDLNKLFAPDPDSQREAQNALKAIGLSLVTQAAKQVVGSKRSGLTQALLDRLLRDRETISLGELKTGVGGSTVGLYANVNDSRLNQGRPNFDSIIRNGAGTIADYLNQEYGLAGHNLITETDVIGINSNGDYNLAEKLGAIQLDKAFGWNTGTGYEVITGNKSLAKATEESFANFTGTVLGLSTQGVSLEGNIPQNYGVAIMAERLGINPDQIRNSDAGALILNDRMGEQAFKDTFYLNDERTLVALRDDASYWEDQFNIDNWNALDLRLGNPTGTTAAYLRGNIATTDLTRRTGEGNFQNFAIEKVWDHYGISPERQLSGGDVNNLIKVLKGSDNSLSEIERAIGSIHKILGNSVDEQANFSSDTFLQYIIAPSGESATRVLLDQGVRLLAQAIGVKLDQYSYQDFEYIANNIKQAFGSGAGEGFGGASLASLERLRQEYVDLSSRPASSLTQEQGNRLKELELNFPLKLYRQSTQAAVDFFLAASGVPESYRQDADAFVRGDWPTGIAATSAAAVLGAVNPYLPGDGQLSYLELRNAFIMDDFNLINTRIELINSEAGVTSQTEEQHQATYDLARRQLMEEAKQNSEYKISDSLLRKIDPTIPVGFSRTMFSGTDAERGAALEAVVFNHLDQEFAKISPVFQSGTWAAIFRGETPDLGSDQLIRNFIAGGRTTLGTFSNSFINNFYTFATSRDRQGFFTSGDYTSMWSYFDGWLGDNLKLGDLPTGTAKSLYFASLNGWNPDAELRTNGELQVASLNSLGTNFLATTGSRWADNQFGLPAGTVFKGYQLYTGLSGAEKELAGAVASGQNVSGAQTKATQAKAALIVFAIELGLNQCQACQKQFAALDKALAAPPGFTQAAVVGAISSALGLGPTGLYVAAAVYLFGVYSVEYRCPKPPQDIYAITEYDPPGDQSDYGVAYEDLPDTISASPAPGQNPFDWDNGRPFANGNDPDLWMGWARYFTGKLIDSTVDYGANRAEPWKPIQLLTYRQANVEYFAAQSYAAFGAGSVGSDTVGIGFSQTTTKTTDWVHIGFGGLF